MSKINWFPGHMHRARKLLQEWIAAMDFLVEIRDARAPLATANPLMKELAGNKPRLILLNKQDLAEREHNKNWCKYLEETEGCTVLSMSAKNNGISSLEKLLNKNFAQKKRKGTWSRSARGLIAGIPNVGKSTIVNSLIRRNRVKVENRPGVTQQLLRIPINSSLTLFDSPGLLAPNLEDQHRALILAILGSIKDEILPLRQVSSGLIELFDKLYPGRLVTYYGLDAQAPELILENLAQRWGLLNFHGSFSEQAVIVRLLHDIRMAKLGPCSLEQVEFLEPSN